MADSGDDGVGSGFTIKEMRPEHVEDAGRALFTAFYVDSLATGVPPTYIIASPEEGSSLLESFLPQPAVYKVVAVDAAGKVLGGACMQSGDAYAHAVGPLFVSPNSSDRGVGKALMRSLVQHAHKLNALSIRLTTDRGDSREDREGRRAVSRAMDPNESTGREDYTYSSSGGEEFIKVCEQEVVQARVLHPTLYLEQAVPKREANPPRLLCPWMGILANINISRTNNLDFKLADGAADIKEKFKEYNPEKVLMFHECYGQQGTAILAFKDGWQGLEDGQAFQQSFVECGRSRKQWFNRDRPANLDLYGWQVNEEDVTADLGKLTEHFKTIRYVITWHNEFMILRNSLNRIDAFRVEAEEKIKEMEQQHRRDLDEMRLQSQAREAALTTKLRMLERCYAVSR